MQQLKIEQRTTSVSIGGRGRSMKEIICCACEAPVRFLITVPNLCPKCMMVTDFPTHNYENVGQRAHYYAEGER